jgi:hypothetical protein
MKSQFFTMRCSDEELKIINKCAQETGHTQSSFARHAVMEYIRLLLKRDKKNGKKG